MGLADSIKRFRIGRTGTAEFIALVGVGLFMAAIGAFEGRGSAVVLYAYWIVVMVGGGVIGALIEPWLWRVPPLAARPVLLGAVQILAMTPTVTVLVWAVSSLVFEHRWNVRHYVLLLPAVFVVNIGVVVLAWLIRRGRAATPAPANDAAPPPAIREKLPPKLARATLIAVEAEDHYLRIHTEAGDALILMRLTDAVAALKDRAGFQTHRSWWVSKAAVEHAKFARGRGELTLANGLKVPVSRAFAASVKDTDWAA